MHDRLEVDVFIGDLLHVAAPDRPARVRVRRPDREQVVEATRALRPGDDGGKLVDSHLCGPCLERRLLAVSDLLLLRLAGQDAQLDAADAGRGCGQHRPDELTIRLRDDGKRIRCTRELDSSTVNPSASKPTVCCQELKHVAEILWPVVADDDGHSGHDCLDVTPARGAPVLLPDAAVVIPRSSRQLQEPR
jgi:hypothetical protein